MVLDVGITDVYKAANIVGVIVYKLVTEVKHIHGDCLSYSLSNAFMLQTEALNDSQQPTGDLCWFRAGVLALKLVRSRGYFGARKL